MADNTRRHWLLALTILAVTAALLIHSINATYMHPDEYLVYRFTSEGWSEMIDYLRTTDSHPPLWWSFFWLWQQLVGSSEFMGRVQAIFFSLLTLAVVYQTGKRWFETARAGVFAVVCLAVGILFFRYALEIRPYGAILLVTALSMWTFQRWMAQKKMRDAALYGVTVAAMLYIHYFLVVFILVQVLCFGVWFVRQHFRLRLLKQGMLAAGVAFVLWLPWLPSALNQVSNLRNAEVAGGQARGAIGAGATTQPTSPEAIIELVKLATNSQILLYGGVITFGAVMLWRQGGYRLAAAWAVGVPVVAFAINLVADVYAPRYVLTFVIGLALMLGASLAALPARVRWWAVAGFAAINLWALPSLLPVRTPYRDLIATFATTVRPGDAVFYDRANEGDDVFRREMNRQVVRSYLDDRVGTVEDALPYRRIWHFTANWFEDEVRDHFAALESSHPVQQVIGDCNSQWCYLIQLLEAPPQNEPTIFEDGVLFWGVDVDAVTSDRVDLRLWWRVEQTPKGNYSIGTYLLDTNGAVAAQTDDIIRHYGQEAVETWQMEPGRIYIDRRTIPLPPTLSTGDYRLALAVYDWQTGERLRLEDASDLLLLDTITIP